MTSVPFDIHELQRGRHDWSPLHVTSYYNHSGSQQGSPSSPYQRRDQIQSQAPSAHLIRPPYNHRPVELPMADRMSSSARLTSPSSDSENYDANHSNSEYSPELPSSDSSSPLILYSPPTFWSIVRGAAINLVLPFVNGLMLGFGELVAHEAAWRLGWGGTKVSSCMREEWGQGSVVETLSTYGGSARTQY